MTNFDKEIRPALSVLQKRLKAGDDLPSLSEIAKRAGLHRDTIYAFLKGENVHIRTQFALSKVIKEIELETQYIQKTRLMSIALTNSGPKLNIGLSQKAVF
jgi:DNA-binding transcriptional regulator YhcF (GntR family)